MANAFRDKLEKWQRINSRDGAALQRYADFLRQCHTAMRSIGNLSVLNDERENRKMLGKLPEWAITKWAGIVDQHRQDKGEFPHFKAFVEFITKQDRTWERTTMFGTYLIMASIIQGNQGNFVSYLMVAHDTCPNR